MKKITKKLKDKKVLVSDGAWGTFLHQKGLPAGQCPESWNLTHPDKVLDIPVQYIRAGADMVLTNSFGASPFKLKHYGLQDKVFAINKAAAEISRRAAGPDRFVLGSIGPTGVILMMGEVSDQELYDGFKQQAKALEAGGADAACIETMSALDEAVIAVKAVKENTDMEIICTFTFEKTVNNDYRTMMGVSPADMLVMLKKKGVDIIGTNCGNGFQRMIDIVKEIRSMDLSIPLIVHANAGKPDVQDGKTIFPETPEKMAGFVPEIMAAGVNIIGGCCGTTPEHIRHIKQAVTLQEKNDK
ncbi:homocysteine S-methyltransferase family protein [candidate division KSB1 bacterium]|nr:homocysteine S-methyltransferase family protein [candidate division KSB1 bacterium]